MCVSLPLLADPQLAIDLLGTLRHDGEGLVDQMRDPSTAQKWLESHFDRQVARAARSEVATVVELRDRLREVFTVVVDGEPPAAAAITELNELAARAPVTLRARRARDGAVSVERSTLDAAALDVLRAECARSALALLTDPLRKRLMLCRAPSCVLFFLKQHPHQQWCSPSCGNRARVARHYARHRPASDHTP